MNHFYSYCLFLLLFLFVHVSCSQDAPQDITLDKREIAMEVFSHATLIDQTEYLQEGLHDDFLSPDVVAMLVKNPFLYRKMKGTHPVESDTVFTYDEIPLIRETNTFTRIFVDGACETRTEFLTPLADNIVYGLTTAPVPEKSRIALTIVKDGLLSAYNADGDLLLQETFTESNMSEFLDTMRVYIMNEAVVRADVCAMHSANEEHNISLTSKIKGVVKTRVELNPEMNKILQYELYHGNNLIQRKKFTYSDNQCLANWHKGNKICDNPASVETYTLVMNGNVKPVIRHSKEVFKRNQTYYYFK
jgi:hypothetical protein